MARPATTTPPSPISTRALRINPSHVRAYLNRGNANFARRDYDRAIADFGQAIRLEPRNVDDRHEPRHGVRGQGRLRPRHRRLRPGAPARSQFHRRHHQPRLRRRRSGNRDRAIADFDQVIRLNPKDAAAYNNRAIALADKSELDRAAADYEQALKLDPKFALRLSEPRPALATRRRTTTAPSPISTQAVRLAPDNARGLNARGLVFHIKGEFDRAIADFDRAIALDPGNANYYDNRGNAWRDRGRLDRAVEDYDKAIELSPALPLPITTARRRTIWPATSRGAGRRRQGRRAERELGAGAEPARADPGEARRARRRHRRSAAGDGARPGPGAGGRRVAAARRHTIECGTDKRRRLWRT